MDDLKFQGKYYINSSKKSNNNNRNGIYLFLIALCCLVFAGIIVSAVFLGLELNGNGNGNENGNGNSASVYGEMKITTNDSVITNLIPQQEFKIIDFTKCLLMNVGFDNVERNALIIIQPGVYHYDIHATVESDETFFLIGRTVQIWLSVDGMKAVKEGYFEDINSHLTSTFPRAASMSLGGIIQLNKNQEVGLILQRKFNVSLPILSYNITSASVSIFKI